VAESFTVVLASSCNSGNEVCEKKFQQKLDTVDYQFKEWYVASSITSTSRREKERPI
jgi:hypothetical protein